MTEKTIGFTAASSLLLFFIMFYLLIEALTLSGWTLFTTLMAALATRHLVQAIRIGKAYFEIKKFMRDKNE